MGKWIGLMSFVVILVLLLVAFAGAFNIYRACYNNIAIAKQQVNESIGRLDTEYQRRYTLINSFLSITKQVKNWETTLIGIEKDTYMEVVEAQKEIYVKTAEAKASATKMSVAMPETLKTRAQQEKGLGALLTNAMDKLMVMAQKYPEIKDPANLDRPLKDRIEFYNSLRILQAKVDALESDIATARNNLNSSVSNYNKNITVFPANIIASKHNFSPMDFYDSKTEGVDEDVKIEF